jgi:predicted metalloprotease with PDZ domain
VTIELNPKWSTVATGLEPISGGAPHTYHAADFDVLYDSPILMGSLEVLSVAVVEDGSAAAKAGIEAGDVIASVDGSVVDAAGLKTAVAAKKPGDRVEIVVRRDVRERPIEVTLDTRMKPSWRLMVAPNPSVLQAALC